MDATDGLSRFAIGCAVCLSLLTGCAASKGDEEGLFITDAGSPFGLSQDNSPSTADPDTGGNAGGQGGTGARACMSLDLFSARVSPRFNQDCVRCHDGTKGKATQLLNLTPLATGGAQAACDATLSTTNQADPAASTILSFVNPDDPSTTHDFKYATSAEYAAYRDDVLAWLMAE